MARIKITIPANAHSLSWLIIWLPDYRADICRNTRSMCRWDYLPVQYGVATSWGSYVPIFFLSVILQSASWSLVLVFCGHADV